MTQPPQPHLWGLGARWGGSDAGFVGSPSWEGTRL